MTFARNSEPAVSSLEAGSNSPPFSRVAKMGESRRLALKPRLRLWPAIPLTSRPIPEVWLRNSQ
jgi:hypothetical protein